MKPLVGLTGRISRLVILGLAISSPLASLNAADRTIVGVLADAVEPQTAQRLELTALQQRQLGELVSRREREALSLSSELRDLPPELRGDKLAAFVAESEKQGFAILTQRQRSQLAQVRLANVGLSSLGEDSIATAISLTESQRAEVAELLKQKKEGVTGESSTATKSRVERQLRQVLNDDQWGVWQSMAGLAPTAPANVASAESPVATAENPAASESSPGAAESSVASTNATSETSPSDADAATDGAAKDAAAMEAMPEIAAANTPSSTDAATIPSTSMSTTSSARKSPLFASDNRSLTLNFQAVPWETVLPWMAKEADLSLQVDSIPPGTFSYRDTERAYTTAEAMDVMNSVLLNKGYTLLRRGRLLMVIDLQQDISQEVVRELAELVAVEDLDQRGEYEIIKCLFFMSRISPDEAADEIEKIMGPQGSVVSFPSAGQVLVTETGGKLRTIQAMLKRVDDPESAQGSKIVPIPLKHISAEEVFAVARPLLGLPADSTTSADLSLASDPLGNTIYATGTAEKMQKLRDLTTQMDVVPGGAAATAGPAALPELKSYPTGSADPTTVYDVLQSLLQGTPDARVALDPVTNNIVLWARPDDQAYAKRIIEQLSGQTSDFEIIPLKKVDVELAIAAVKKFYGGADDAATATGPIVSGDALSKTLWVKGTMAQIDQVKSLITKLESSNNTDDLLGDFLILPYTGTAADRALEQVEAIWQSNYPESKIRIVMPKSATEAQDAIPKRGLDRTNPRDSRTDSAMRGSSRYQTRPSSRLAPPVSENAEPADAQPSESNPDPAPVASEPAENEPADNKPAADEKPDNLNAVHTTGNSVRLVSTIAGADPSQSLTDATGNADGSADDSPLPPDADKPIAPLSSDIVIMRGPNGLIVSSEDKQALAKFERLMSILNDQSMMGPAEPTVFYLKYIRAAAASELLNNILNGTASGGAGGGGGLLGDMASNMLGGMGGGLLGGLLGGGGGASSSTMSASAMATGDVSMVADPRLNALIVQANPIDLRMIEQLLEVIDQEDSPLLIETRGRPRIIPILFQEASAVASIVKEVFADRIASQGGGGQGGQQRQPSPQEFIEALRGGGGGGRGGRGGASQELKEMTMTVGVDSRSNSLIVTASTQLFEEVEYLVEMIDVASDDYDQDTVVAEIGGNINPEVVKGALMAILGASVKSNSAGTPTTQSTTSTSSGDSGQSQQDAAANAARREAFMNMLQQRGGGGGSTSPFGGGASGSTRGGFGGFGGGAPTGGRSSRGGR